MIALPLRTLLLVLLAAALAACGVVEPATETDDGGGDAVEAAPADLPNGTDLQVPDPSELKLKKSKAKTIARVTVAGDSEGRDDTFTVVGRRVPYGGCIERRVSHEDSLLHAPRELYGLAENPKLDDKPGALASVQVVTLMPEGNGLLHDMPVSFSARYGQDEGGPEDFIAINQMPGFTERGYASAVVERKKRRVNVTITGYDEDGVQIAAAFSCRLPKDS